MVVFFLPAHLSCLSSREGCAAPLRVLALSALRIAYKLFLLFHFGRRRSLNSDKSTVTVGPVSRALAQLSTWSIRELSPLVWTDVVIRRYILDLCRAMPATVSPILLMRGPIYWDELAFCVAINIDRIH